MSRLPRRIVECCVKISSSAPQSMADGLAGLLEAERRCAELARGIESFREAARDLGILEESRNGQRVYDAWCKLSHFFLVPIASLKDAWSSDPSDSADLPSSFESLGARWDRTAPEVTLFLEEEKWLDQALQTSPVSTHVGARLRARLLLLDRRAERIKVALDLLRDELSSVARWGAEQLTRSLAGQEVAVAAGPHEASGGQP